MGKKKVALPSLKNYSSRTEWEAACWQEVVRSEELLQTLTTNYERHHLVLRAAALEGLALGKNYKQIGEELFISPQTISTIKKSLTEKSYRSYLERSKKERRKRNYSANSFFKPKRRGRPVRTKYGTIRIPN